jgi:DNA-binding NtrC family response regulator
MQRATSHAEPPPPRAEGLGAVKIALVDTDLELRTSMGRALRLDGHSVAEVASGQALLELLILSAVRRDGYERPEIIIADVGLPDFGRLDVIPALRMSSWSLRVILTTRAAHSSAYLAATTLDALAVLAKPFEIEDLRTLVMNARTLPDKTWLRAAKGGPQ